MIKILDGPAAGQTLWLRRAPLYLRVVNLAGEIDALDQLDDEPRDDEVVYAYRAKGGKTSWVHLHVRGKHAKSRGGFWGSAEYELCPDQPAQEILRDTERWREWAAEQYEREKADRIDGV
jgi:hypothetical protein